MSLKLETVVGQLSVVAGVRQEQATSMAAIVPARAILRKPKEGSLYIVLEVTGDPLGRDGIYRELIRIISEEYFRGRGSITAKLRQAIGAANSFLLKENLSSLPHEQRTGGVTCAVLREGNVYIAQAGQTTVYVLRQGELTSFPESELTAEEATPLGFKREVPVRFYYRRLGAGDVVLLADSPLAQQVSPEQIAQALVEQDVEPTLADLEEFAGGGDISAMVIRVVPAGERPGVKSEVTRRPAMAGLKATAKERLPRPDWGSLGRGMASLLVNTLRGTGNFLRRLLPEPVPSPSEAKEAPAPSERVVRPRQPYRAAERGRNLWMGTAIAIPVIVIILVIAVYWRQGTARQARFEELVGQAQQQMALAEQVDEATARGHLLEALDSLAEAEKLKPGQPPLPDLREETANRLKAIDRVIELHWISPLWEYSEPGSDPSRVIINGIDLYVLDKGLDRVYKHLLDDNLQALQELEVEPVLLRKGDQRDPIVVGELVDMVWGEAKGGRLRGSLLVLESGGWLLEYDPIRGISVLPVGGSDSWMQPQIAGSYQGNFYLLDSSLNQILRYEPDYGGLPEHYFPTPGEVDLAGVVDMAVDGQIYVLYADGRILKFLGGQPAPFELVGLYEPLRSPTALFTSEEAEFLYVADAGNKRIVQLTKEGQFLRQFKAGEGEALDQLKGLFASEAYHRLYFVSGNKLYVTNIPSE
jgi:hypothetical protein